MSDPSKILFDAVAAIRKRLETVSPSSLTDFDMLMSLSEDEPGPFDPAGQLRIDDMALRAFCDVNELVVEVGQIAGLKTPPSQLAFLLGLKLGYRVAREQVGR